MKKTLISLATLVAMAALALTALVPSADAQVVTAQPAYVTTSTAMPVTGATCYTFNQNMGIGVPLNLQDGQMLAQDLTRQGLWNSETALTVYTENAAVAVSAFQDKYASEILAPNGLTQGTGYVGVSTRAKLNSLYGCGSTQTSGGVLLPVQCPVGYTCTPIVTPAYVLCPIGLTCTPIATSTAATSSTSSTSTNTTASPSVSISLSGQATIQSGGANQFGQTNALVATFPLNVTSQGGTLSQPAYNDFVVVFTDASGNSYTAPNISVSTTPNSSIGSGSTAAVTVTAQIPNSSLPSSGLYNAAITSFHWNQDGNSVTQGYGLTDLRTTSAANFIK